MAKFYKDLILKYFKEVDDKDIDYILATLHPNCCHSIVKSSDTLSHGFYPIKWRIRNEVQCKRPNTIHCVPGCSTPLNQPSFGV